VSSGQNNSWEQRHQAGKARDDQRNAAWVQSHFGGSVGQTLVRELPLLVLAFLVGLFMLGWRAGLINVALLLIVILGYRAWARRRYGLGSKPATGPADSE
jgi:hypothetical protein